MRLTIAATLVLAACSALPSQAQTVLQLQWELKGDVFADARDRGASRAVFTLTNKDTRPLPPTGWAIYFNALLPRAPGSEKGGNPETRDEAGDKNGFVPMVAEELAHPFQALF